ncbi:hypothetical protein [Spirosoma utsteinense]|uniref:GLPGLI family protein n=1 Tax=Spirosoma utsteinense TaxID=2585773 RepID=A0ABR6W9A3_9BACT|nr:hypothetical protein [Spirosoma utsteinense]MBC3788526.1 hypothetical protein [Spirosoma utsteinense]MBC3793160.1 hypothetical protein [Spirosoma utsteinense]
MIRSLYLTLLSLSACLSIAVSSSAQTKAYTYLIYHKLSPGLTIQDALPVEREWKAVNQASVDEGNLIGWYMMAKQMSSNTNPTEYDYVTVIVTPTMSIKGASPAGMAKVYGDSVQIRMADLQKRDRATAPVVKMEIWETVDAVFSPDFAPDKTPLVVLDYIRLRDPAADWFSLVGPLKRIAAARVKENAIGGWDMSRLVVPNGSEKGYGMAIVQTVANLNVLAGPATTGASAEGDKVRSQATRTFDVVRQEVFRLTEYTARPKATASTQKK